MARETHDAHALRNALTRSCQSSHEDWRTRQAAECIEIARAKLLRDDDASTTLESRLPLGQVITLVGDLNDADRLRDAITPVHAAACVALS